MNIYKKITILLPLFLFFLFFAPSTFAAAPDGMGPWADSVVSSSQGLMKNGLSVPAIRSNPNSALGIAENNTVDGNFYSLGFGGNIILGFDNGISSGVIVVEATNPGYPAEKAKVEVSENGTTWFNAGTVTQDGSVNKPEQVRCARYVRLTDVSNPPDFSDGTADGYDVDGVQATGNPCSIPVGGCQDATLSIDNLGILDDASKKFGVTVGQELLFHIHVNNPSIVGNQITFSSSNPWLELIGGSISDNGASNGTTNFKIIWPKINDGDVSFKARVKTTNLIPGVDSRGNLITIGAQVAGGHCNPHLELYGVRLSSS